ASDKNGRNGVEEGACDRGEHIRGARTGGGERDKRRPMETAGAIYRECHALLVVHGHDLGLAVTVYRVEQRSYHAARQCEHVRYLAHGEPVGEVITDSSRRLIP